MKKVPAATINGKYSTYENSQKRDLVHALGHVVDLELEDLVSIEIGAWGTQLKIRFLPAAKIMHEIKDGITTIRVSR